MQTALTIIHIIISVILIVFVLLQNSKDGGINTFYSGQVDESASRGKSRTLDAILTRWTTIVAIIFVISTIAINYIIIK